MTTALRAEGTYLAADKELIGMLSPRMQRILEMRFTKVNSKYTSFTVIDSELDMASGRAKAEFDKAFVKLEMLQEVYDSIVVHKNKIIESQQRGIEAIERYLNLPKFKGSVENQQVNPDDIRLRINEAKHDTLMVESGDYSSLEN